MPSKKLAVALYRSLLRNAKVLDSCKEFKALLPREVEWRRGEKWCDFYALDESCVAAVRDEFRAPKASEQLGEALDEALAINKTASECVHMLYRDEEEHQLLQFTEVPFVVTFEEKYEAEKARQPSPEAAEALNGALELVQSAADLFTSEELPLNDKKRLIKAYYEESLKLFETADAHAYLGWQYYVDKEVSRAVAECERAIEMDPAFGNSYNNLGLIRLNQGDEDEAKTLFMRAKAAPRNDMRHFASVNLAKLHLDHSRVKDALHEYIEALHWMPEDDQDKIRKTVHEMGVFLINM